MTLRLGINGFGRIGRSLLRAIRMDPAFADVVVTVINDPAPRSELAHLFRYDSVMGPLRGDLTLTEQGIQLDGRSIRFTHEKEPGAVPWGLMGVDYVIEASGRFNTMAAARRHLDAGAARVIIASLAKGDIPVKTVVLGVNEGEYDPAQHRVISNASCTTNCLAVPIRVLQERFGVHRGFITTVHAYTNDQNLLDAPHGDLRRARAAALSMIPTKTGGARAIGLVIPALRDKFDGLAVRVPTPNVSLLDMVVELERPASAIEINQALAAAAGRYLGYSEEPLVSIDYAGNPHSAVVDALSTRSIDTTAKVLCWYDNEWGYSNRLLDLALYMAARS